MTALAALIAKLEAATEGSRELDWLIFDAVYGPAWKDGRWWVDGEKTRWLPLGQTEFSTSLDAALTLVPAGWQWWADKTDRSAIWAISPALGVVEGLQGHHPTSPALALCIAALRARQA